MKAMLNFVGVVALLAAAIPASLNAQTNAPRITSAGRTNGVFSLAWTNVGTNGVTIERRTSLTSGSWTAIASNVTTGAHNDTNAPGGATFYRVVMVTGGTPPPSTNMELIPAGSFSMGNALSASGDGSSDELPVHTVNVSAFYMDKYEVTKALWDEVANWAVTNGYDISIAGSAWGKATNHPVVWVSWYDAVMWCNARSQKEGLTPCYTVGGMVMKTLTETPDCNFAANGYRLPTEAEWEKAARGGLSGKRFPWGDTITHSQANYYSSSSYNYDLSPTRGDHPTYNDGVWPYTSPVGSFGANGYGLYDMAGNTREWCWDWYDGSYYSSSPSSDPRGPSSGLLRVFRGGSWNFSAYGTRTANRFFIDPGYYDGNVLGFRCARSAVP